MQSQRNNQQLYQVLVEYMERHGDLCKTSASSQNRYDNFTKWTELTNILNSTFPEGARSCERWKRAWSDYKNNVRKKAKHIQESNRGTLTELEERLLKIVENQEQKNDYTRTTDKQYVMMVEFMERNGDITTKYSEALEQEEKWAELTELLNSASPESPKSDTKWKRVWKYIKSYTKKKADKIEATKVADTELYGTTVRLTDLDQRILRIIRPGETDSLHDDIISQAWASLKKAPNTEASVSGLTTADFQRSILQMTETQPGVDSDSSGPSFGNYVHVPPSQDQYNIMCDYMERHGDMRLDPGREGREEIRKKWEELTELLNSSPSGPKRSEVEWQKVWTGLKGNLKRKMKRIEIRKAANKKLNTPGMILSKLDQRVLKLTESWTKANKADRELHDNEDMSETSQHSNISEQAPKRNINKDVTKTKQTISCVTPIDPEQSIVQITGTQPSANVDLQQDSSEPLFGNFVHVPPSQKQYNIMCDYMERHGDMRLDTGRDRRDDIRKKWEELTELLNSLPSGPKRSVVDWQKAWSCLKSNIKRKVKRIESNLEKRKAAYKKLDTPGMIVTKLDLRVLKICESWTKADNADRELNDNEDMSETSQHSNISEAAPKRNINKDVTKTKQSISCVTPIVPEQSIIQITGTQPSANVDLQQDSLETSQHSNNGEQAPKRNINKDVTKTKQSISCVTPIDPEQSIIQITGTLPSADVDLQQNSLETSQHSNISEQAPKRNINKDVTKTKQSISCVTPIDPEQSILQITGTQPSADVDLQQNSLETSQHSNISEQAPKRNINKDVTKTKQSISCVTPIDPEQSILQITGTQPSADVDLQQNSLETSQHSNISEQAPKRNINKDVTKTKQSISCVTPIDPEQSILQITGTQPSADVDLQQNSLEQSHDYKRTTHKQYVMMVKYMERYGDLLNNCEGRQAKLDQKEKWAELTQLLNSASPESAKSDTKWKRVWKYIKYYTIKKANKIDAKKGATVRLTDLEQRILRIAKACDGLLHEDNISEAWASSKNADFQQSVLQMTEIQPGVDSDQDSSGPSVGFYAKEPPSHEQYNIMCDYMERHGNMRCDSSREGREEIRKKWEELTELLNSSPSGPKRSVVEWQKVWKRLKSQLKRKINRIEARKAANKKLNTPGMILSKLDQRILKLTESWAKADKADRELHDNEDMSETSQHSNISEQAPKRNINKNVTKTKKSISCVTPIDPEQSIVQITGTQPSANVDLQQDSLEIKPVIETLTDEVMSDHEDTSGAIPVVKVEIGPVCHGCLITDRKLLPLGSYRDKFVLLIQNQSLYHNDTEPLLCCECLEMLKKFDKFQEQLINSQMILKQMNQRDSNWSSISQVQKNTKEHCDKAIEHATTSESPALEKALEDAFKHNGVYIKEEDSTTDYLQEDMHIEEPLDVKYLIKEIMNPKNCDSEPRVHNIIDNSNQVKNEINYIQDDLIDNTQDETNKVEMNLKHSDLKPDDGDSDSLMNDPSHIQNYVIEFIEDDDIMDVSEDEIKISNINEKGNEIYTIDLSQDAIEISNINEKANEINSKEGSSYSKSVGNDKIKHSNTTPASVKSKRINTSYHPYMDDYVHAKRITDINACNEIIRKKLSVHFLNEHEMEAFAQRWNTTESQRESFECDPCNKIFVTMKDLLRHKDLNHHNPEDPYVCSFCNHNLSTFDDLKEHWLSHSAVVKCNVCQRIYRDDYIKKNGHTHNIIHECRYCDSYFAEIRVFSRHYWEKHASYICDHCQNIYRNKKLLIQHICKVHKTATPFKCLPCKKSFFSQNLYDQHWKLYHEPSKPEDRFCEECGKLFDTIKLYQRHLDNTLKHKKRFRTKTAECPECGVLIREKILPNHMKKYHPDPKLKKYQCKICGVYLDKDKGLQYHLNTVHFVTKLRRNVCDVCGERFHNEHALRRHRLRHTGERPHRCAHCRKHFLYKTALIKHLRVRHGFN